MKNGLHIGEEVSIRRKHHVNVNTPHGVPSTEFKCKRLESQIKNKCALCLSAVRQADDQME